LREESSALDNRRRVTIVFTRPWDMPNRQDRPHPGMNHEFHFTGTEKVKAEGP
jgi:hypothetical protein